MAGKYCILPHDQSKLQWWGLTYWCCVHYVQRLTQPLCPAPGPLRSQDLWPPVGLMPLQVINPPGRFPAFILLSSSTSLFSHGWDGRPLSTGVWGPGSHPRCECSRCHQQYSCQLYVSGSLTDDWGGHHIQLPYKLLANVMEFGCSKIPPSKAIKSA